jgi:pyruvate/2-oxoglutarate dehydrogenase complex dihydrolipoamide dehydrogenase (E3) component
LAPLRWRRLPAWVSSRPELASLGLTLAQATAEGRLADVVRADGARVVVDRESGAFLGLHATGVGAIGLVRGAAALLSPDGVAHSDLDLPPSPVAADVAAAGAVLRAAGIVTPVV